MLGPDARAGGDRRCERAGDVRQVALIVGALMVLGWVRAADLLRPIVAARNAKRAGRALDAAEIAATERAVRARAVRGRAHPLAALVGGRGLPRRAPRVARACWPGRRRSALACITLPARGRRGGARAPRCGSGGSTARAGWCCRTSMPCATFAAGYRRWLCQTAGALLAVAHAVNAALISVFTDLTSRAVGHAAGADACRRC